MSGRPSTLTEYVSSAAGLAKTTVLRPSGDVRVSSGVAACAAYAVISARAGMRCFMSGQFSRFQYTT